MFPQAVAGAREARPARHWIPGAILGGYGKTLTVLQRYEEAETALLEAHELITAGLGPQHERTTEQIESLIELYDAWHEAEPDQGHDVQAADWRAKLPDEVNSTSRTTDPPARPVYSAATDTVPSWRGGRGGRMCRRDGAVAVEVGRVAGVGAPGATEREQCTAGRLSPTSLCEISSPIPQQDEQILHADRAIGIQISRAVVAIPTRPPISQ